MSIFKYFFPKREESSASTAKDRLQIIIASERSSGSEPPYMRAMQEELLAVIRKYVHVSEGDITITKNRAGETEVLDVNVNLGAPELAK